MNTTSTQVLFKREPEGFPTAADFEIVETQLPELVPNQFLVRGLYLSLDPYMRMLMGGGWKFRGHLIFDKSLRLQGFLTRQYLELFDQGRAELEALVASGGLRYRETIATGIENAPEAFIGMLNGRNLGKQLVKLS